jgi:hypothetical protein
LSALRIAVRRWRGPPRLRQIEAPRERPPWPRRLALGATLMAALMLVVVTWELTRLSEALTADAALAAEAGIADIADRLRAIRNVALAALGAGTAAAAVGITLYTQRPEPDLEGRSREGATRESLEGWQREHLARAGELARRHHQAQRNLDHWRDALPTKLQSTIFAILMGSPPEQEEGEAEAPFAAVSEAHPPAPEDARPLPDPVPELIDGIRDQLVPLTARAADLGMATVADCIVAASASARPRGEAHVASQPGQDDPDLSVLRLETITATVEQVVIQIGLCLGDINALSGTAEAIAGPGAPSNVELAAERLQGLFEELVIAREHLDASGQAPC